MHLALYPLDFATFGGPFLSGFVFFDCPFWKLFPMEYTTLHIDLGTNSMLWIAGNWQILQGKKIIYHVIAQWQISASGQIRQGHRSAM